MIFCTSNSRSETVPLKSYLSEINRKNCINILECQALRNEKKNLIDLYENITDYPIKYQINKMKVELNDLVLEEQGFPKRCASVEECRSNIEYGENLLKNLPPPYTDATQLFRRFKIENMNDSLQRLKDDLEIILYRDELSKKPGVKIGMTKKQVIENSSWGKPISINKTKNRYGVNEQWVYGDNNYLYFNNGVLESIQN
jgi:hypothetical protein